MKTHEKIYLSTQEFETIKDAIHSMCELGGGTDIQHLRQLAYKLSALQNPQFGAVIISDPSDYSEES